VSKGLRETMPTTAWLVDQLRLKWGAEQVDALLKRAMRGEGSKALGSFYVAEIDEGGELREFGATVDGRSAVYMECAWHWVDAAGKVVRRDPANSRSAACSA